MPSIPDVYAYANSASLVAIFQLAATATRYLKDVKGGYEDRIRLREEIRSTICLLEILNDRVEDAESSEKDLVSIRSLSVQGGPLDQLRNALDQLVVKLTPADVNALLSAIERQKVLFGLAIQNDNLGLSKAIKFQVEEVSRRIVDLQIDQADCQKRIVDQEGRDVINWISPLTFWRKQTDVFSRRTEGTGGWLLESAAFQNWVAGREKVLWCSGIRAGKTVLASVVINYLQQKFPSNDFGIAFVYCNYKERKEQSLINLISSLLGQLIDKGPEIPEELCRLYRQHKGKETRPSLSECLKLLQYTVTQFSMAFVIVDALDECWEIDGTRRNFIRHLRQLLPKIRLFCTSRNLLDIECEFKSSSRLEIRASDTDIRIYLETCIQQEPRHIQTDLTLLAVIVDAIIKVADGMFLLAQLHIESIATKNNRKAIRSALARLPPALDETYEEVLKRIYCQNKDDVSLAEKVLSWVSFSARPLRVPELQHAIAIMDYKEDESINDEDLPDEDVLLAVCAGIVIIDRDSNVFRLVHYTTQEFFERNRMRIFVDARKGIAIACISYLSQGPFREGPCIDKKSLETRFQRHPLLNYVALNWGNHARGTPEKSCNDKILAFLDNECLIASASQAKIFDSRSINIQSFPRHIPSLVNASMVGLPDVVAVLLGRGSDVEESDDFGVCALIGAAQHGHETVAELLLAAGARTESRTLYKSTSLIEAASEGNEHVVKLLLDKGADLEARNLYGSTALHGAAKNGHKAVIEVLLGRGADVETDDLNEKSALYHATIHGHREVAELLLESAILNGKDGSLASAFSFSVKNFKSLSMGLDFVELLIDMGASIAYAKRYHDRPILHDAARCSTFEIVKLLIGRGADALQRDGSGRTALHCASFFGKTEVINLLIKSGAVTDAQERSGYTPLHYAALNGESTEEMCGKAKSVVIILLKSGADVNKCNSCGETVLHLSAKSGYADIVELLIENGADIEAKDHRDWTALQAAAAYGQKVIVEQLLAFHAWTADPSPEMLLASARLRQAAAQGDENVFRQLLGSGTALLPDAEGKTALHLAAFQGHNRIVEMLLEREVDVDAVTTCPLERNHRMYFDYQLMGKTALHLAASEGHATILRLLIENNAHINMLDGNRLTPLIYASLRGHLKCVRLLLEHKADLTIATESRPTPLYMAVSYGHEDVVRLLLAYGADQEARGHMRNALLEAAIRNRYKGIIKLLNNLEPIPESASDIQSQSKTYGPGYYP